METKIKTGRNGTTISIKVGKGEDVRNSPFAPLLGLSTRVAARGEQTSNPPTSGSLRQDPKSGTVQVGGRIDPREQEQPKVMPGDRPRTDADMIRSLLGKMVCWSSSANGTTTEKLGRVVAVRTEPGAMWSYSTPSTLRKDLPPGYVEQNGRSELTGESTGAWLGQVLGVYSSRNAAVAGGSMSSRVIVLLMEQSDGVSSELKPAEKRLVTPVWSVLVPLKESRR